MPKTSAGLLLFRFRDHLLELFLVHPGGPFWAKKDLGAWSIPKGEYEQGEDPFAVARREFQEETGQTIDGEFRELNLVKQPGGKQVRAWAVQGDCDAERISSNTFTMEWPPKSGRQAEFPEVDRAGWFTVELAREKILKGQLGFIDQLCGMVSGE
ncbi:NUDIX domain-containing protein [Geomonas sp. Red32]|uniref:NUDIX domain-containing protein n=1 Tax=Geomonas sp. Red32 TaxID=2912856 RepID=UPI00202CED17|nr:NUDIX domain-containing protein [Geomonas sp. Red32]MCM0084421.1 NUDIX domain-containing protein [Geomonas sp. Red32]